MDQSVNNTYVSKVRKNKDMIRSIKQYKQQARGKTKTEHRLLK